jgi:hypothetical protein
VRFKLRALSLQNRHSPPVHFAVVLLEMGSFANYFPELTLNSDLPDRSLPSSKGYRYKALAPGSTTIIYAFFFFIAS